VTRDEIRTAVLHALSRIAPEAALDAIDPRADLRAQVDIDSMDFLNLMIEVHRTLGVDVPESDYAKLRTLDACVDYLAARAGGPSAVA
jgi:acyl carrier protein